MVNKKDVFLCHSSEDRERYVISFETELKKRGISYWLGRAEIGWGEKIVNKINEGLEISRFVVVFLSPNFIGQSWAEAELASALSKENDRGEVIVLPILIGDKTVILKQYPLLQSKKYVKWSDGINLILSELESLLGHIGDNGDDFKKNGDEQLSGERLSKRELLGELQTYGAMIRLLKTYKTHQQQLNLSLHNHFSRILLAKYDIFIKDAERSNALQILNNKVNTISTHGASSEDEHFNRNFPKDIINLHWSVSEVKNLVKDIIELVEISNPSPESDNKMAELIEEFHTLCYGLYSLRQDATEAKIRKILAVGHEMDNVEFKSTLMWDIKRGEKSKEIKKAIAKTMAAFMNSKGGTLLIGVDDDGNPIGLDYDFKFLDRDKFLRSFGQIISNMIGPEYDQFLKESRFVQLDGKDMFYVKVDESSEPGFVLHNGTIEFFVRVRNTSRPLNVKDAISHYKMRWGSQQNEA